MLDRYGGVTLMVVIGALGVELTTSQFYVESELSSTLHTSPPLHEAVESGRCKTTRAFQRR